MNSGKGNRTLATLLLVVFVALAAFGLGAGTMFVANQLTPSGSSANPSTPNGQTSATDGSTTGGTGQNDIAKQSSSTPKDLQDEMKPFWDTFNAINEDFYHRPVDRQKMIYGAAKGMMESLGDDYSVFLTPQEAASARSHLQGNFEGVGMYFEKRNDLPTVVAPIPNTPADRAGVRAKDLILAVDGRDIIQLSTDQIAGLIRGPAGTKVRLTMKRGTEPPFEIELTRARIEVPAVTLEMLPDDIAHIKVSVFGEKVIDELDKAVQEARDKKAKGIILDVRNNGGGLVVAAQAMLGRFLPPGTVAFYESRKADGSQDKAQMVIGGGPTAFDIPLVVLVNGGSASASELVAGALQDHERAKLIGEQTFGKGSEQQVHTFDDGSSARITFAHWLTPKKRDINPRPSPTAAPGTTPVLPTFTPAPSITMPPAQATATAEAQPLVPTLRDRGLTPDIEVIRTEKDYTDDKDPQLDRAVEYIKNGK